MAVSARSVAARSAVVASRAKPAVVCRAQGDAQAPIAAVALAAAALLTSAPAQAGVILENQPAVKKLFQADDAPAAPVERKLRLPSLITGEAPAPKAEAPKAEAAAKPIKVAEESVSEGGLDPRAVALPASVAVIAGLGLAVSKIDGGFNDWINESGALVRNSAAFAGFEEDIKGGVDGSPSVGSRKIIKGTTKVAFKSGKTVRKA